MTKIDIAGMLHAATKEGKVADAAQIKDTSRKDMSLLSNKSKLIIL